jgi:hypothetical protein
MPQFRLPLSGDVNQAINPWQWFIKSVGGQFGLVNINLGRSSDPELEGQILDEVGSYGKQLGRVGDVLGILLKNAKAADYTEDEWRAISAFRQQLAEIHTLKVRREQP